MSPCVLRFTAVIHSRLTSAFIMHSTHTNPPHKPASPPEWRFAIEALVVFACALSASLLGILTRTPGELAAFWPANALLLGLFLRYPKLAEIHGWMAATAGLCIADMLFSNTALTTLWLTSSNMLGIAAGYLLYQMLASSSLDLKQSGAALGLLLIVSGASLAEAVTAAGSVPLILGQSPWSGFCLWFSTELLNYLAILPVLLTLPSAPKWRIRLPSNRSITHWIKPLLPLLSLGVLMLLSIPTHKPIIMALLPLAALLWCSSRYSQFITTLLVLTFCMWLMLFAWPPEANSYAQLRQVVLLRLLTSVVAFLPLFVSANLKSRTSLSDGSQQ